jgi:hypothetical protein
LSELSRLGGMADLLVGTPAALLLAGGYMTRVSSLSVMRKTTYVLFGSPKMIGRRLFRHIISLPNRIKSSLLMAESCPMVIFCGMILF